MASLSVLEVVVELVVPAVVFEAVALVVEAALTEQEDSFSGQKLLSFLQEELDFGIPFVESVVVAAAELLFGQQLEVLEPAFEGQELQ